ncbi:MAG: hypothetical protein KC609_11205 [Myxococcales bacterium]|nr:hypothetical protein [Myxococcales bacterium]
MKAMNWVATLALLALVALGGFDIYRARARADEANRQTALATRYDRSAADAKGTLIGVSLREQAQKYHANAHVVAMEADNMRARGIAVFAAAGLVALLFFMTLWSRNHGPRVDLDDREHSLPA